MNPRLGLDGVRHNGSELTKYKELVEDAKLYDLAAKELGLPKDEVKIQLLSYFFAKPRTKCIYTDWFSQTFPTIHKFILETKKVDYRFLGNFLQQIEVDIVLNKVCRGLMLENPGIPLLTIHDCIGTTEGYQSIVLDKFTKEFKYLGICPKIKKEG